MTDNFLQVGKSIKMEISIMPSCSSFRGTIEKIEKDTLTIKINGQYIQKEPQIVKCTISNSNKTRICLFETIIKYGNSDRLILIIPNKNKIKIAQRRNHIRVSINKEVNCYLIEFNDKKVESNKTFPAIAKDISGGGVLLNSILSLPVGTILVFETELDNTKFLLTIKVLRNLENEYDGTRDLGCQFVGIDDASRQKIIAYCNKEQSIIKRRTQITG